MDLQVVETREVSFEDPRPMNHVRREPADVYRVETVAMQYHVLTAKVYGVLGVPLLPVTVRGYLLKISHRSRKRKVGPLI